MRAWAFSDLKIRFALLSLSVLLFSSIGLQGQKTHDSEIDHYHLSAFGGFTTNYKGKQGYKIGIEYEYRLSDLMGLGGTFDFTGRDFSIFAFSVGTTFYPFKFPLIPAIGIGAKSYDGDWNAFLRGILTYNFHLDKVSLGPMIMYDAFPNQKDIMSYGITVGFSLH